MAKIVLTEEGSKPSAPAAGAINFYAKTDGVVYVQDDSGTETAIGTSASITSLTGDVTATGPGAAAATVVSVGGQSASTVAAAVVEVEAATHSNVNNAIVQRDSSGNFSANIITATFNGNASTATTAGSSLTFSGPLAGDVSGNQSSTVVNTVGGATASDIASATATVDASTSIGTPGTLVKRDGSGNFTANNITANITGNISGSSSTFTGSLSGDVTGTQSATVVGHVGGKTASDVANATTAVDNATSANTASTIVERDASGNFSAGTISSNLTGNVTGNLTGNVTGNVSGSSSTFTGSLSGDVTGTQSATIVSTVGGKTASDVASATSTVDAATPSNTASTLVERDASGNFHAGMITASLIGNVTGNVSGSSSTFTNALSGDVTGNQTTTVVSTVGGKTASDIAAATAEVDAATSSNTSSTLVLRDASGNFSAGNITANLTGNVSGSSSTFTGSLSGDVTGTQSATSISNSTVTGKLLTGYTVGSNTPIASSDSILTAFEKVQAQLNVTVSAAITALTGDVTATGPGSVASTVTAIQGHSVSTATPTDAEILIYNNSTSKWTPNAISGDISLSNSGVVTLDTVNSNTGNFGTALAIPSITVNGKGLVTAVSTNTIAGLTNSNLSGSAGITGANIASTTVANTNLAQMPPNTVKANTTGTPANPVDTSLGTLVETGSSILTLNNWSDATIGSPTIQVKKATTTQDGYLAATDFTNFQNTYSNAVTGLTGDVSATGPGNVAATVNSVGGSTAANIHSAEQLANAATSLDYASTIVRRDGLGNFGATTITSSLIGNVTGNVSGSAASFTGSLSGDVTGTQNATVVSTVGTSTSANIHSAEVAANAATSANTNSTIVKRDSSGNFATSAIELSGTAGAGYLQLDSQTSSPSTPSTAAEKLYASQSNGITRFRSIDNAGTIITHNRDSFFICYNNTGSTIPVGTAVYISGVYTGGSPNVATVGLAKANSTNTAPAIGFTLSSVANNSFGQILFTGQLNNINLSAFTNGQAVYLSPTTPGGMTATEPSAPNVSQLLGYVINNSSSTGVLDLSIRSALNTASGTYRSNFQVGPQSGSSPVQLQFVNSNTGTISWNPSSTVSLSLPSSQGGAGSYLSNDGAGNLSWTNPVVNIDGGSPTSNYTAAQLISGGTP